MPFCILIVLKWHSGKKVLHSHLPFSSSYHPVLCRYPVRLEQQLLYFHVAIRPLKGNKMGQGVGGWLEQNRGSWFRQDHEGKSVWGNTGAEATCRKWMHEPCEGLGNNILCDNSMVGMGLQCLRGSEKPVWLGAWVEDSTPELSEMNECLCPFLSKVKLAHPPWDCGQPRGGAESHTLSHLTFWCEDDLVLRERGELEMLLSIWKTVLLGHIYQMENGPSLGG